MGRKVWFPAVSGPLSAYAAGYVVMAADAKLFAVGDLGQVVAVRSAEPLARARGACRRRVDRRSSASGSLRRGVRPVG